MQHSTQRHDHRQIVRHGDPCSRRLLCVVLALLIGRAPDAHASTTVQAARSSADVRVADARATDCHTLESSQLVLHSDPWINVHHFLFEWARNDPKRQPADRRLPVQVKERDTFGSLSADDQAAWSRAVRVYDERIVGADLVSDRRLIGLRDSVGAVACSGSGAERIADELRPALTEAMPVYRRHWWRGHHDRNMEWIRMISVQLLRFETALLERLSNAYGGQVPRDKIRVDVSAYAYWPGAYTTNAPNQVTISSTHPHHAGLNGVEVLFHELSHGQFFEQPISNAVTAALRKHGAHPPRQFLHVLQFVTPYELLRALLPEPERQGYRSYPEREGLYERLPEWARFRRVLEAHWVPFLEAKVQRAEALDRLAIALVSPSAVAADRWRFENACAWRCAGCAVDATGLACEACDLVGLWRAPSRTVACPLTRGH